MYQRSENDAWVGVMGLPAPLGSLQLWLRVAAEEGHVPISARVRNESLLSTALQL